MHIRVYGVCTHMHVYVCIFVFIECAYIFMYVIPSSWSMHTYTCVSSAYPCTVHTYVRVCMHVYTCVCNVHTRAAVRAHVRASLSALALLLPIQYRIEKCPTQSLFRV